MNECCMVGGIASVLRLADLGLTDICVKKNKISFLFFLDGKESESSNYTLISNLGLDVGMCIGVGISPTLVSESM